MRRLIVSWPEFKRLQDVCLRASWDSRTDAEHAADVRAVVGPIPDGSYKVEVLWNRDSIPYEVRAAQMEVVE